MAPSLLSDQLTALRLSFTDSALPGLKVICGFGSPLRRFAWLLVFLGLFALTINDIVRLAMEYYKYPDSLNIKYEEPEGGKDMPMPSVTVCNLNPYKIDLFCKNLDQLLAESEKLVSKETQDSLKDTKQTYCSNAAAATDNRIPVWNLTKEYMQLMQRFTEWSGALQRYPLTAKTMVDMSHHVADTVEVNTFNGFCQEGKSSNSNDVTKYCASLTPVPTEVMYPRYGKCFCYFCNYTNEDDIVRMQSFDGPHNGLMLVLKVEDNSYLPFIVEAGFVIAIHDQGVEVDFTKDGVFIQPLTTTYIGVSRRILRRLEEPFQNPCRKGWPPLLKEFVQSDRKYTAVECRDVCLQYLIQARVKCTSLKYGTFRTVNTSDPSGYSDFRLNICGPQEEAQILEIETNYNLRRVCDCKNVCEETNFDKTTSSLSWHPVIQAQSILNEEESSKAQVYVYMQSNLINNRTKVQKMNSREFVSGIGSIMGMYLGYSFLFCWNILDVLGRAAFDTFNAMQRQKAIQIKTK